MFLMTKPVLAEAATSRTDLTLPEIVQSHQRALYFLALDLTGNHHDAEDLSQEVFIKAHRALDRFRGDSGIYTWLRRIAINTHLNRRRKLSLRMMRLFGEDDTSEDIPTEALSPASEADGAVLRVHIERAMLQLSPRERTAFVLRHHQDMSIHEVAEAMEVADGTVKSLLFRATQKLQQALAFLREEASLNLTD